MRTPTTGFLALFLVVGMLPSAKAQTEVAALPYPNAATPPAIDLGAFTESDTIPIAVTIALRWPDLNGAESLLQSLYTPSDSQYHQFLTADQFVARFAPADADVAKVMAALAKYGLAAQQITATTLKVTGRPADIERAFSVSLHRYEVPSHANATGYTFRAPLGEPTIPAEISASVGAIVGLDSRPSLRPLHVAARQKLAPPTVSAMTGNAPGFWTVTDFANYYDVQPLYARGLSGKGRTLGIVTFASFTPSDAFAYWSSLGLSVDPNRIKTVNVDGGPGAPSDASGSMETTIDVEQSGGIGPGAHIIVYQAPNTDQGFVDGFAAAIDANSAETLSVSWGDWEWCTNLEYTSINCPTTPPDPAYLRAVHELFVRAAIQGQTLFASSGDDGAYDNDADCPTSDVCSNPLSVDYPASDPAITAAGGTTLAGVQQLCLNTACTPPYYDVDIPHERVWGWDYLQGLCTVLGTPNPITCGIFPVGSGGGVSILFEDPSYQFSVPSVQLSQPHQRWIVNRKLIYPLPSNFPGRNVPDVSFNADPDTGYVVYYTSSVTGFAIQPYWGGTSFVAPQLNGVSALFGEYLHGSRFGLLNFPLYGLALSGQAYGNAGAPLHAIAYGDNWFYHGSHGYNPAAGLGTLDVANFAQILRGPF